MGIMTSLFTGVSGLTANGMALSVVGDNIANSNTNGFKGSRVVFGDILSQSMGGSSATQVGRGAMNIAVQQMFGQSTFESTSNPLDMAIDGSGFFVVNEPDGGGRFYTRAGQFTVDKDGYIVTPEGLRVQGYGFDSAGNLTALQDINIVTTGFSAPSATATINMQMNLDSRDDVPTVAWAITDPTVGPDAGCYNYNSAITVYDSQGNSHLVNAYFVKTAANDWDAHFVYNDSSDPLTPNYVDAGTINLTFDENGELTAPLVPTPLNFDFGAWTGGAAQAVDINMGYSGINSTQYGAVSSTVFQNQDGWSVGNIRALTVSKDGVLSGVYTNGQVKNIATMAVAYAPNPAGMSKMGKNLYAQSYDSGGVEPGIPGASGRGTIVAGSLETSNVDLAEEFVKLIAYQRGFQANTRVITTTDDMLNELMAIKR